MTVLHCHIKGLLGKKNEKKIYLEVFLSELKFLVVIDFKCKQ